jgi:DegV family protein with EDD domain
MTVRIMTDSAADIPEKFIKEYNLALVPTVIRFGEEIFYENVDLDIDEYYKKFSSSEAYPQTANPTLQHQYELFEKLGKEADEVLNIVISSGISGSYNTAINARRMYERKAENPAKIHIYDSKYATFAIGVIAIKAAELAQKGKTAEEIIPELDKFRDSLEVGFTVANLKYLHRGGRLSGSKYLVATIADLKPVINFVDGKMEVIKKVRGFENAVIESFDLIYEKKRKPEKFNAYIMHAQNLESAELLKKYIKEEIKSAECNISINSLGMTIVTHAGPGCIGVCLDTEYRFLD